ncbi:MAG TPA: hypothetical protein VFL57_04695 [Bryobacteraceae bacterium]|nr:hypothetical protein [Bryobacteraceae bacterium]
MHATTLVAVWTPERLLLGADSLTFTGAPEPAALGCKIACEGDTYFALSGLVEDRAVNFELATLARQAMKQTCAMDERLAAFREIVRPGLARALALVKKESPADFEFLLAGHPVVQAIFAEVQAGSPLFAVASFQLAPTGELREYSAVLADQNDTRGPRIIYAGQQGRIREYLRAHQDWAVGDQPQLVRELIELEIRAGTGRVGGPVDLLSVAPGRAEWISRKSVCAD